MGIKSKLFGVDPKFRAPRIWSNHELNKLAKLCSGKVVNVSGWKDGDKQGRHYKDYFKGAENYTLTNYSSEYRGFQNNENEINLDLENEIPIEFKENFDVVFNHTTLEHIFEVQKAFSNLVALTKDILIVVVPFLQEQHAADFGDYWRFTPMTIKKLMEKNNLKLSYLNYNDNKNESIYIVAVGCKSETSHLSFEKVEDNQISKIDTHFIGTKTIKRGIF